MTSPGESDENVRVKENKFSASWKYGATELIYLNVLYSQMERLFEG